MVAHAGGPTITFVLRRGGDDGSDETMGTFEIYTVPGDNPVHQYIGHWQPPNLVPDSQLSFTRARTWLEKCQRGHVECQRFNSSYMPKRVLEIVSDPMEEARFRVCLSADPEPAPYATLSYCWGGDQEAKTTMTRLPSYHDGIPLEKLPRTIRDALTITHGVGLKYLWVDSICIVQDSDADKAEQISQMHRIYRGALFTVAVAAAKTSVDGFLEPRRAYRGTKLGVRLDDNVFSEIVAVPTHTNRSDVARTEYPLYTRGWTYQESQLSTRVFAYGDREMVYQCLESRHRDGGQDIAFNEGMPTSSTVGQIFRGLDPGNRSIGRLKHPIAWRLIVTTFTHRALTVADDKLLAIAAIAEDYANTKPVTKYLAGLWEDEFLYECLWSVKPKAGCTRPSKYRAPSWSWASMEGVIEFYLPSNLSPWKFQPSAKLLQAETTLSTKNNPFGMVKEGFIRILAKCRRVVWLSPSESSPAFDPGYGWACNSEEEDSESPWRTRRYKQRGDNRLSFIMDVMEEWPKSSRIAFWCVEVYTFNAGGFDMDSMSSAQHRKLLRGVERAGSIMHGHALVLQEETQLDSAAAASLPGGTSSSGVFHRVGVMRAQGFPREDPHFADWPYWFDDDVSEVREFTII
ncbi:heterokaryon incompatibility protein-domain-containing protein [Podospora didyma]|uniref:Heterokaryon incompatibility protein-domain-containing protein n=1 Tax=Podospora didyma TaxID=330526 RepID=A0AAE0K1J9_9PEZI|nr:heterokaryon incompatibility protein-domain-containing protein [Podospora didyma]